MMGLKKTKLKAQIIALHCFSCFDAVFYEKQKTKVWCGSYKM